MENSTWYKLDQHRTNESTLGNWRGNDLLKYMHKMQLRYFGHVARRDKNSLEKNCMMRMKEGQRNRERPRLRWTDNVKV